MKLLKPRTIHIREDSNKYEVDRRITKIANVVIDSVTRIRDRRLINLQPED